PIQDPLTSRSTRSGWNRPKPSEVVRSPEPGESAGVGSRSWGILREDEPAPNTQPGSCTPPGSRRSRARTSRAVPGMHTLQRLRINSLWLALTVSAWGLPAGAAAGDRPGNRVDYGTQIKPILSRHCVSCHGASKPRGGLRLDTAAAALKGGK